MKHLSKECKRLLIYDTMGEYDQGLIFENVKDLIDFWGAHIHDDFRLIYQPLQPREEFENICKLVYACGDMVFVAEEIDSFCTPTEIRPDFANIIQRGRHKNITFYGVSQRPYGINRIISAQSKEIYTFQQSEPRDIEYLTTYIGQDVEKVRELPQYNFLHWQSTGQIDISKV